MPDQPDILIAMNLAAELEPDRNGLLQRNADSENRLTFSERSRMETLRANRRRIGGIDGEEIVERFADNKGAIALSFWWEANGTEDKVFIPHVLFKMDTGIGDNGRVSASLSDDAAIGLWDKITSPIRLTQANAKKKP